MADKVNLTSRAIIIMSLSLIGLKYLAIWIEGFAAVFIFMFGLVVALILIVAILLRLFTIVKTKRYQIIIPAIIGVLSVLFIVYEPVEKLIEKAKSPVVFSGNCEHTVTMVSFVFREDSTFEYNAGAFLHAELYYGDYVTDKDTLTLNFNTEPGNMSNKIVFTDYGFKEVGDTTRHRHHFKYFINNLTKKPTGNIL